MTKLAFIDSPKGTTFGDLKVGDLFTVKGGGLFIRTDVVDGMNAVIIVTLVGDDSIEAGHHSWWPTRSEVIRVTSITATKES